MSDHGIDVIAAGHICLDIIPQLDASQTRADKIFVPGGLVNIGPATFSLGGSVANTGIALHRLGAKTRCVGKIGADLLGKAILELLQQQDDALPKSMLISADVATSYTIVLSPPGVDRGFLHCPGANDSFVAADLPVATWPKFRILHFGYPPLMRGVVEDQGRGLAEKFAAAQAAGALVSLDMAMPPASSAAESVDWRQWLANVLPHVDVFLPSCDELAIMLGVSASAESDVIDSTKLTGMAGELFEFGVPIVAIKLGDQGLYLRTSDAVADLSSRSAWHDFNSKTWHGREILVPCLDVPVAGTTGAGDCTIAGFLKAMLQHEDPATAIKHATMVGAFSVQSVDATSNIPSWTSIADRDCNSWPIRTPTVRLANWRYCEQAGVFVGPLDADARKVAN